VSVSIIIVSYNGRELLGPCLESTLPQAEAEGAEVVVVDNASSDGTAAFLRERFPSVALVRSARNVGFAAGSNLGARAAHGDRIVILNNDAIPDPGWLRELLAALEPDDVAVACSVVHDPRFPDAYALGTGSLSVIGHPIPNVVSDLDHPFYATGCSLAFKRSLLGEPFDAAYFAYYEDALLSWRARLRGYRVARALGSSVQHQGSATARRMPDLATYYYERNKLLTLLLGYEPRTLVRLAPLYLFDALVREAEDWRLILTSPTLVFGRLTGVIRRYELVLRGLGWLIVNSKHVWRHRAAIQRERRVSDAEILPMLSAKVHDDYIHTRVHEAANRLARWYCRLVGVRTAETASAPPDPPR
jgi:GT2 family glycosyltransferase